MAVPPAATVWLAGCVVKTGACGGLACATPNAPAARSTARLLRNTTFARGSAPDWPRHSIGTRRRSTRTGFGLRAGFSCGKQTSSRVCLLALVSFIFLPLGFCLVVPCVQKLVRAGFLCKSHASRGDGTAAVCLPSCSPAFPPLFGFSHSPPAAFREFVPWPVLPTGGAIPPHRALAAAAKSSMALGIFGAEKACDSVGLTDSNVLRAAEGALLRYTCYPVTPVDTEGVVAFGAVTCLLPCVTFPGACLLSRSFCSVVSPFSFSTWSPWSRPSAGIPPLAFQVKNKHAQFFILKSFSHSVNARPNPAAGSFINPEK